MIVSNPINHPVSSMNDDQTAKSCWATEVPVRPINTWPDHYCPPSIRAGGRAGSCASPRTSSCGDHVQLMYPPSNCSWLKVDGLRYGMLWVGAFVGGCFAATNYYRVGLDHFPWVGADPLFLLQVGHSIWLPPWGATPAAVNPNSRFQRGLLRNAIGPRTEKVSACLES